MVFRARFLISNVWLLFDKIRSKIQNFGSELKFFFCRNNSQNYFVLGLARYRHNLVTGLAVSVGGVTEATRVGSWDAVVNFLRADESKLHANIRDIMLELTKWMHIGAQNAKDAEARMEAEKANQEEGTKERASVHFLHFSVESFQKFNLKI